MKQRLILIGWMMSLLSACAAASTAPTPTATVLPPTPNLASPTSLAETSEAQGIEIEASDGLKLKAAFRPGSGPTPRPGVILLHESYEDRGKWRETAPLLAQAGFATLALDLRGHGKTGGEKDWLASVDDMQPVWEAFAARPEVDPQRIALVGASFGANLALLTAASHPEARGVVLLSPGIDYFGVKTEEAMRAVGTRPVWIAAAEEDEYAAQSSRQLAEWGGESVTLRTFTGKAHGTQLLEEEPGLQAEMIAWLEQVLSP